MRTSPNSRCRRCDHVRWQHRDERNAAGGSCRARFRRIYLAYVRAVSTRLRGKGGFCKCPAFI